MEQKEEISTAKPEKIKPPFLTPRLIKIIAVIVIVAAASSYLIWQFSNFSRNPALSLAEPVNDITVSSNKITFKGNAEREGDLTINGQGVFVNEDGTFAEEITLQEGLNKITVIVRDRQGRETSLTRQILLEQPAAEPDPGEATPENLDEPAEDVPVTDDESSQAITIKTSSNNS